MIIKKFWSNLWGNGSFPAKRTLLLFSLLCTYVTAMVLLAECNPGRSLSPNAPDLQLPVQLEDSVSMSGGGKLSALEFSINYSADAWFKEFSQNKVAFDKMYDNRTLDINGVVTGITNNWGCSSIEMETSTDYIPLARISFLNCPSGNDTWVEEVTLIAIGDTVHIRGEYNGGLSSEYEMNLSGCHIIPKQ